MTNLTTKVSENLPSSVPLQQAEVSVWHWGLVGCDGSALWVDVILT